MHALHSMKVSIVPDQSSLVADAGRQPAGKLFKGKKTLKQWRQNVAADLTHFPVSVFAITQLVKLESTTR